MNMQHTKEPWRFGTYYDLPIYGGESGMEWVFCIAEGSTYKAADVRRIVECVNACAGIETDKLEAVAFLSPHLPDGAKDAAIELAEFRMQRDKLADSIRSLLPFLETHGQVKDYASLNDGRASDFGTASLKAREALAEVEGGAAC